MSDPRFPSSLESVLEDGFSGSEEIVHRFIEDFSSARINLEQAEEIFRETKRWLWLCAYRKKDFEGGRCPFPSIPLASEAIAIDLMWHTFLLFTKEYAEFCHRHFGFFIHHQPTSRAQKALAQSAREKDPEGFRAVRMNELKPVYEYIHDVLGRDTLIRWFDEFPKKYASLSSS